MTLPRRTFGRTGWQISNLSLGTVSLGRAYGLETPGEFGLPSEEEAERVLHLAAEAGINLFDTAPAYGVGEERLGRALGRESGCRFASKVAVPRAANGRLLSGAALIKTVRHSVEESLKALRREALDLAQIHNATEEVLRRGELAGALEKLRRAGRVLALGVSVYTEVEAAAALETGLFAAIQIPYNLLDRRPAARIFSAAQRAETALLIRSVWLKGALTPKAAALPPELAELRAAVERVQAVFGITAAELPRLALRFCLSAPISGSVLVGARTEAELRQAISAAEAGALNPEECRRAEEVTLSDERLLNPALWPIQ